MPDFRGDPWRNSGEVRPYQQKAVAIPQDVDIKMVPRAGHADRNRTVDHLARSYAHGYLDEAELERRTSHALAAPTHQQLQVLLGDLPPLPLTTRQLAGYAAGKALRSFQLKAVALTVLALPLVIASATLAIAPTVRLITDHLPYIALHNVLFCIATIFAGIAGCAGTIIVYGNSMERMYSKHKYSKHKKAQDLR